MGFRHVFLMEFGAFRFSALTYFRDAHLFYYSDWQDIRALR